MKIKMRKVLWGFKEILGEKIAICETERRWFDFMSWLFESSAIKINEKVLNDIV